MIETKEQILFTVNEIFVRWCKDDPWYNATICHNLCGPVFEYFFANVRQVRYKMMCVLNAHDKQHEKISDKVIFGGVIPLPDYSTTYHFQYLSISINFIYKNLKSLSSIFLGIDVHIKTILKNSLKQYSLEIPNKLLKKFKINCGLF